MSTDAVEGLRVNLEELRSVLDALGPEQWESPSACAGWRVQDVVAHLSSSARLMTGESAPPALEGDPPGAEAMAELLIAEQKAWTWEQVREEFDRTSEPFLAALAGLQDEPVASAPAVLGDLGTHPTHILANAFCFDAYCHLRHDIVGPGTAIHHELPEPRDVQLRPGIDWMLAGLPQMCADALAPVALAPVRLELTGPGGGTWVIGAVDATGLVPITEGATTDGVEPVATVVSSAHDFVSWATTRSDWRDACTVTGDQGLAAAVLDAVNVI